MRLRNRKISFWLLLAKLFKVIQIKLAFVLPTLRTKMILSSIECPYGKNLQVCGKVYFRPNGKATIKLSENVSITARFLTNTVGITNSAMLEFIEEGRVEIGNNSGLTAIIISARKLIHIGDNVKIGGNMRIFDHDFHSLDYRRRRAGYIDFEHVKTAEAVIEDDVLIDTNATILKGVHIGARSIMGADSVVTCKNIPSDSLVIGNPAAVMKRNAMMTDA